MIITHSVCLSCSSASADVSHDRCTPTQCSRMMTRANCWRLYLCIWVSSKIIYCQSLSRKRLFPMSSSPLKRVCLKIWKISWWRQSNVDFRMRMQSKILLARSNRIGSSLGWRKLAKSYNLPVGAESSRKSMKWCVTWLLPNLASNLTWLSSKWKVRKKKLKLPKWQRERLCLKKVHQLPKRWPHQLLQSSKRLKSRLNQSLPRRLNNQPLSVKIHPSSKICQNQWCSRNLLPPLNNTRP